MSMIIKTRYYGGAFIARGGGKTASSTNQEKYAAAAVAKKLGHPKARLVCVRECELTDDGWQPGIWKLEVGE